MNKNLKQWLIVYLAPYALIGIFTFGAGLFLVPLGGTLGVFVGLTSDAPFFTFKFRLTLMAVCIASIIIFIIGYKLRSKIWGKILNAAGSYLWCFAGIVGFGPQ